MGETFRKPPYKYGETLIGAVSFGIFLLVVGTLFITIPGLFGTIVDFFQDFSTVQVPNIGIYLPAPLHPAAHGTLYLAVEWFSLVWGIVLIGILVARFALRSPNRMKSDNLGDIVFWLGAAYLTRTMLIDAVVESTEWFAFWAAIVALIGVSFIVRAIFLAVATERTYSGTKASI